MGQHSKAHVEVHYGLLTKGEYPSREQLDEEIHSQVKIYETALDAQKIALQLQAEHDNQNCKQSSNLDDDQETATSNNYNSRSAEKMTTPRYTSTSKLAAFKQASDKLSTEKTLNNQLNKPSTGANNYAFTSSWYQQDTDSNVRGNLYQSQYNSAASWKPNIAASCGSTTDNYSSVESSRV